MFVGLRVPPGTNLKHPPFGGCTLNFTMGCRREFDSRGYRFKGYLLTINYKMYLGDLFNKYGSDKDRHGYTPIYDSLFKKIRQNEISLLEIGIGTMIEGAHSSMVGYALPGYAPGGSLRAWRDYFPRGDICGIDVQPDTQFNEDRIITALADSTNKEALDNALKSKQFDIIVDDGSHYDEHQLQTLENLWDRLKPGGYYIIEDLQPRNRIHGEFRDRLYTFLGKTATAYFNENKKLCIISRIEQ